MDKENCDTSNNSASSKKDRQVEAALDLLSTSELLGDVSTVLKEAHAWWHQKQREQNEGFV